MNSRFQLFWGDDDDVMRSRKLIGSNLHQMREDELAQLTAAHGSRALFADDFSVGFFF